MRMFCWGLCAIVLSQRLRYLFGDDCRPSMVYLRVFGSSLWCSRVFDAQPSSYWRASGWMSIDWPGSCLVFLWCWMSFVSRCKVLAGSLAIQRHLLQLQLAGAWRTYSDYQYQYHDELHMNGLTNQSRLVFISSFMDNLRYLAMGLTTSEPQQYYCCKETIQQVIPS